MPRGGHLCGHPRALRSPARRRGGGVEGTVGPCTESPSLNFSNPGTNVSYKVHSLKSNTLLDTTYSVDNVRNFSTLCIEKSECHTFVLGGFGLSDGD